MIELLSIPAIMAATEAVKMAGLPSRFAALFAIAVGAAIGALIGQPVEGFVFGLAASGTYSSVKNLVQ